MIHSQDEIRELDRRILELHNVPESEVITAAENVMRFLISHDWPEWARSRNWCIHDSTFDSFDLDDAEYIRRFTIGVVTVLKSNGQLGVTNLKAYAAIYLKQRGILIVPQTTRPNVYGVAGLAKIINVRDNETARNYLRAAELPVATGRGKRISYTHVDAERFAKQVIANPSHNDHSIAAEQWLEQQKSRR
jgi:hypothetical protein